MMSRRVMHAISTAIILLFVFVVVSIVSSRAQEPQENYGVGIPDVFVPKYLRYRTAQLASSTPDVLRIPLGNVKGLSTTFTRMAGEMAINLQTGAYTTSLNGLTPLTTYAVWLVDRTETDFIPPTPDALFRLTTFLAGGPTALLTGSLALSLPLGVHHRPRRRDARRCLRRRRAGRRNGERLPEDVLQTTVARE